jgi:hypothetical protein
VYQDNKLQLKFLCLDIWWHYTISFPVSLLSVDVNESAVSSAGPVNIKQEELQRNHHMRGQTVGHIFELIEDLKREIALLKALVQQAISDKEIKQDILVDDVAYLGGSTDQDRILVDACSDYI